MKTKILSILIAMLLFCGTASAQRKPKTQTKPQPAAAQPSAEQMQREMQNATPGAQHNMLAKLVGDYTTSTKFTGPGAPAMESAGEAKLSMTLDGRFLVEEDSGTFAGQPSKSFKMLGYNNASKRYEAVWTYTMSTAIMTMNGTSPDGGRTINFNASWDEEGGAKRSLQVSMRLIDDDHFVVELTDRGTDGKQSAVLVTTYSRKEKPPFGG